MESAGIAGRGSAAFARLVRRGVGRCRTRGIVYGLINSANRGLTDPVVLGCVALGTGLLLEFILVEGRSEAPMLLLDLSRSRTLSRAAGAVAAEIMGVVMRGTFEACLDDRLESVPLPADAAEALDEETVNLAAANIPTEFDAETTAQVQAAIDVSFVSAFRIVAVTSSIVALASAAIAAVMIEGTLAPASVPNEAKETAQPAITPART